MAQENSEKTMGLFDHVDELRSRVMISLVVFFIGFGISFGLTNQWVMDFLREPLFAVLPEDQQKLYFTSLFENFLTHLKIAAVSSIFFLSPFYFYQLWAFIAPGLFEHEKRMAFPFVFAATFFFVAGGAFAYYVLFPVAFKFFVTFGMEADTPLLTIDSYYTTCLKLLLLFGCAFNLPVVICLLGALGVIDAELLRKKREFSIIGITVLCAMFAPPDAISMIIMMIPLILMYEGSIFIVAWLGARKRSRLQRVYEEEPETVKKAEEAVKETLERIRKEKKESPEGSKVRKTTGKKPEDD